MTDRIHALTVALDVDIREDDIQQIVDAIKMIRHVLNVEKHVTDVANWVAEERIRSEIFRKLLEAIQSKH